MSGFQAIEPHEYMSLTTYKKNGDAVATPVWLVSRDGKLYVWTDRTTWKTKRLLRDPRCTVAPCNASGSKVLGPAVSATARLVDASESAPIIAAVKSKYGWKHTMIAFINRFRGLTDYIVFELTPA